MNSLPKVKLGKVGVGSNIAQNHSRLASMKSYLIIIYPNAHDKLIKSEISRLGLNIAQNHSSSPWEVISGHCLPQFA